MPKRSRDDMISEVYKKQKIVKNNKRHREDYGTTKLNHKRQKICQTIVEYNKISNDTCKHSYDRKDILNMLKKMVHMNLKLKARVNNLASELECEKLKSSMMNLSIPSRSQSPNKIILVQ